MVVNEVTHVIEVGISIIVTAILSGMITYPLILKGDTSLWGNINPIMWMLVPFISTTGTVILLFYYLQKHHEAQAE